MNKRFFPEGPREGSKSATKRSQLSTQPQMGMTFGKNPKISDLVGLETYKKIEKPNFNDQQLKTIAQQLALEEQARIGFANRKQAHDLMVKFDINPFTKQFQPEIEDLQVKRKPVEKVAVRTESDESLPAIDKSQKIMEKMTNIIEELNKFRQKNMAIRSNMGAGLHSMMLEKSKISYEIMGNASKLKLKAASIDQSPQLSKSTIQKQSRSPKTLKDEWFTSQLQLESILKIKESSYYLTQQKIDNIFVLVFHHDNCIKMGNELLEKYYFCYDSMKDVLQKMKISTYRDLSKMARQLARGVKTKQPKADHMEMRELNFTVDNIQIDLLLSVASGRSLVQDIAFVLAEEFGQPKSTKNDDQTSSTELVDKQVIYEEGTQNMGVIKGDQRDDKNQIKQFIRIPLSTGEINYEQHLKSLVQNLRATLEEQRYLKQKNIKDQRMMDKIKNEKQKHLNSLIVTQNNDTNDIDRLIRRNKFFKDRREEIRIKALVEATIIKKEHQFKLKQMKSENSSPSKQKRNWK